jgi:hypothetical protein
MAIARIIDTTIDIVSFLFEKAKELFFFLLDLLREVVRRVYEKFIEVSVPEKIVFLTTIAAFLAVILPVAKFYIFRSWFYVNNPLAVYMVAIAAIMFASVYFQGRLALVLRLALNAYYLFWVIYIPLSQGLTRAQPHSVCIGYYLNILVPLTYMGAGMWSFFFEEA